MHVGRLFILPSSSFCELKNLPLREQMRPTYRQPSKSLLLGSGIVSLIAHIGYLACAGIILVLLGFAIFEVVRLGTIRTNTETLLTNTDPFPICESDQVCCSQYDCPVLQAVDLHSLDNTSWWAGTYLYLNRACLLGKCFYSSQFNVRDPNMTLFRMGENWRTFFEDQNASYYYNASFPSTFFGALLSIDRTTMEPWSDPFSSLCMAFMEPDSRTGLKAHAYHFDYTVGDVLEVSCVYTYGCTTSFTFPGNVQFPQGATP